MSRMLDIQGLTKRFGALTAVDDVSFSVDRGEVLGFLGPNGAGKSTTMKMVTGYLTPTSGTALVSGSDVTQAPIEVKSRIGYLPEGAPLYEDMTPDALLRFVTEIRGISGKDRDRAIASAAENVNLREVMYRPIGTLSKGFKRRVGLAQAIVHDPEVLILDEPTDGLDPNQKYEVRQLINRMAANKAIIISTHLLEEVEAVCTRAIIIARGKIVADGTPFELQARSHFHNAVTIRVKSASEANARTEITQIAGVARVESAGAANGVTHLIAFPEGGQAIIEAVSSRIQSSNLPVEELRLERGHLDDVFRQITTGGAGGSQ
jgi:ABC-2 type transport system ATP-binding protein